MMLAAFWCWPRSHQWQSGVGPEAINGTAVWETVLTGALWIRCSVKSCGLNGVHRVGLTHVEVLGVIVDVLNASFSNENFLRHCCYLAFFLYLILFDFIH